ncbi:MAG: DUF6580 family putative transport protein [Gemmataceae bacterium]
MHSETRTDDSRLARICAAGMAVAAGLIRLFPHPFNFTPIAGLGLFGGARLGSCLACVLPLAVMAVSDVLLWAIRGHSDFTLLKYAFNPWVYASFLFAVLWGRLLLRHGSAARIAAVSVLVSVQFFLVTNFGVWLSASVDPQALPGGGSVVFQDNPKFAAPVPLHYSRNLSGLIACYVVALPFAGTNAPPLGFFGNQLVGDLFYTALLFAVYALLSSGVLLPRRLREPATARMP